MGEFDLQTPFLGPGARAEDFQNEAGAVENLGFPRPLKVALLNRTERIVDDHELGLFRLDMAAQFLDLAGTEKCRRARTGHADKTAMSNFKIDRAGEAHGFLKAFLGGKPRLAVARFPDDRHEHERARPAAPPVNQARTAGLSCPPFLVPGPEFAVYGQISWTLLRPFRHP